jgi:cell division septum initiation protein DivIVA
MADPLASQDIARRTFDVARRGYEQQEVRGFLHEVSALVERLVREANELRERAERAEARLGMVAQPDEAMLLEVLGEETTRVLTSAREAAAEIRSKAEASAERIIAEATSEATELRGGAVRDSDALMAETKAESESILEAARTELERRSAEAQEAAAAILAEGEAQAQALRDEVQSVVDQAREEAESILEGARQQGREMVAEAQAVRERVLRDLAVRRKKARQQVEKLNAGRERLLKAYDVVRHTVDEATDELKVALTDARIAADAAARRVEDEAEPTIEQLDAEVAAAGLADLPISVTEAPPDEPVSDQDDGGSGPLSGEVPVVETGVATEDAADDGPRSIQLDDRRGRRGRKKKGFEGLPPAELTVVEPPATDEGVRILAEPADGADAGPVTEPMAEPEAAGAPPAEPESTPEGAAEAEEAVEPIETAPDAERPSGADDVFAKLRAGEAEDGAGAAQPVGEPVAATPSAESDEGGADEPAPGAEGEAEDEVHPDAAPFAARHDAVEPVEKELGRRLKRALADEQNEVLDLLRRAKPKGVDDLLPDPDEHAARWAEVVAPVLTDAAGAGASWAGGSASSTKSLADELARHLTAPLRERIERSFSAADGNLDDVADRVRALYREWKGKRLTEATQHFAGAAYAQGVFDGIESGARVRWVVDPEAGPCPDCDDNVLAGAIPKGEDFPTGSPSAPAHPGCHCLVLVATP